MYLNAKNIIYLYVGLLHSRSNIHVKLNVLHNFTAGTVITLNGTDFTTFLSKCFFFPYVCLIVFFFFIMIMNRLHYCQGRMLTVCAHAALEQSLDLFFPSNSGSNYSF